MNRHDRRANTRFALMKARKLMRRDRMLTATEAVRRTLSEWETIRLADQNQDTEQEQPPEPEQETAA